MADRDTDMIGRLAALVVAVLAYDQTSASAYADDIRSQLRTGADDSAVPAALRARLRFDPAGLAEIGEMTGESKQLLDYLLRGQGAPQPVRLARMKVWRQSEVALWWANDLGRPGPWTDTQS